MTSQHVRNSEPSNAALGLVLVALDVGQLLRQNDEPQKRVSQIVPEAQLVLPWFPLDQREQALQR